MSTSLYDLSVGSFLQMAEATVGIMQVGQQYCDDNNSNPGTRASGYPGTPGPTRARPGTPGHTWAHPLISPCDTRHSSNSDRLSPTLVWTH